MVIQPIGDRILVKRKEADEVVKGGIIIPDTAKEKQQRGTIIAIGKGKLNEDGNYMEPEVKEGNVVIFGKWAGSEIEVDGEELLILRGEDILGICE